MTIKIERIDGVLKTMEIRCDHPGCLIAPTDEEVMSNGGLTAMGWRCSGGKHFCPAHRSD